MSRFWYENGRDNNTMFNERQLDEIRRASLARVICDNTGVGRIQQDVFRTARGGENGRVSCDQIER